MNEIAMMDFSLSGFEGDDEMDSSDSEPETRIYEDSDPHGLRRVSGTTAVGEEDAMQDRHDDDEDDEDDENIDPEMGGENDPFFDQDAFDDVWAAVLDRQAEGDYSQEELDAEWLAWFEPHGGAAGGALLRRVRRGTSLPLISPMTGHPSTRFSSFAQQLRSAMATTPPHNNSLGAPSAANLSPASHVPIIRASKSEGHRPRENHDGMDEQRQQGRDTENDGGGGGLTLSINLPVPRPVAMGRTQNTALPAQVVAQQSD